MSNRDELRQNLWSNAPRCECCTGAKYHCTAAEPCKHCETFFDYIDAHIAAEVERAEERLKAEERSHEDTVQQRDDAEEWADRLAHLIAVTFNLSIGEHSNVNNPWHNAAEYLDDLPVHINLTLATSHKEPSDAL